MSDIRKRIAGAGLAFVLALGAGACNGEGAAGHSGCNEYCERLAACEGAGEDGEERCKDSCSKEHESSEEAGCAGEHDEFYECLGHASQVCDSAAVEQECAVSLSAWQQCLPQGG